MGKEVCEGDFKTGSANECMQYEVWKQTEHRKQQNEGKVINANLLKCGV
jgi:hypothetical protein